MFKVLFVAVSVIHASTLQELKADFREFHDLAMSAGRELNGAIARDLLRKLEISTTDPLYDKVLNLDNEQNLSVLGDLRARVPKMYQARLRMILDPKLQERSVVDTGIEEAMRTRNYEAFRVLTRRVRVLNSEIDELQRFEIHMNAFFERK